MESTTFRPGERRSQNDQVVTVEFDRGGKGYSYFTPFKQGYSVEPGAVAVVIAYGEKKTTTVTSVRASTSADRLKRVHLIQRSPCKNQERVYYDAPPAITEEPDTMNIKITNKTFVNGTDIKDLSDDQVVVLLGGVQSQIDTLSNVKPMPLRFAKKIQELEDGRRDLIALLDSIEPKEA